ncbi:MULTISPECIES: heme biosynthesis protein HemY [Nitrosomonas]|uniref:HemY protein n=2 Tax=Nitrosomonas eutropha TaxID=916 RepID=A0ABX5MA88_9PROT|nr:MULTISPECIES: heme biosynthesis protein HemY [Nitrosomonas]ABI59296.1 HemY domain protein [Nitrosomonas eutropha C91]MXS81096.1 heme biosynthesis protein HemY [Nitrosomonas sp. GH22]PXV81083.1 HemY protein [Nitrosomonas eutropha]SDW85098.1 HemY protein [Nitrosomonas eutropha]SEI96775.1 HemY protein [Nitrosomonas eutropha]
MKLVLWVLALFASATAIVLAAYYNTGSVLFTVPPYKIELAFNTFIIMVLSVFTVFYMLLRILSGLSGINRRIRAKKAEQLTWSGVRAFFEARYDQAMEFSEKAFKLADTQTTKVLNAVVAARSAHQQRNYLRRDHLLTAAREQAPVGRVLTLITEAELFLDEGRYHDALTALQSIYSFGGLQSTAVLLLELKAQQMAGNWDAVLELTEVLSNRSSVDRAHVDELRHQAHLENIKKNTKDIVLLKKYWGTLPWQEKTDGRIAVAAARALMAQGDNAAAQKIIENGLDAGLYPELVALYADCQSGIVSWQIQRAESWLVKYPNNADLLLALGRLCTYGELWGKAQNYLEASLSIDPGYPAHLALAQLFEKLGKQEAASEHYRKGLDFALKQISSA